MGRNRVVQTGAGGVTDRLSFGVLARMLPRPVVDEELRRKQRKEKRIRSLPAHMVVYYVIAMSFFSQTGVEDVLRWVLEGIRNFFGLDSISVATKGAITSARIRLGSDVIEALYKEVVKPQAIDATKGAWYNGLRLVAMDGSTLDLQDTHENAEYFGYAEGGRGECAFPKLRFVSLAETGTHVLFGARMGVYKTSEHALAQQVIDFLEDGMLCLADRLFYSYDFWNKAKGTGAHLLWRVRNNMVLPVEELLADGSWLTTIYADPKNRRQRRGGVKVRSINYRLKNEDENNDKTIGKDESYLLLTTLLNCEKYPAEELAGLYPERWEIETAYDEFKTHLRGGRVVLRSKTPELVKQEFYGFLMAHFCTRQLMHEAALVNDIEPLRLSFTHTVEIIKRKLPTSTKVGFSPSAVSAAS
jgi:hypothetical protein